MNNTTLNPAEEKILLLLSVFGLLVPNGIFIYYALSNRDLLNQALQNPISLVFIGEAFFLMLLFAWLIKRLGVSKPSSSVFIVMSLVGSLVFSVPAALYVAMKRSSSDH